MKKIIRNVFNICKRYIAAPLASVAIMAAPGCATGSSPLLTPQTAQVQVVQTNYVTATNLVVQTNTVVVTQTNGVTLTNQIVQTILQTNVVPILQTNIVTVTNAYVVNSTVSNVLAGASTVNALSAPVNPFSSLIAVFLGLTSSGLAYYARLKTQQAQNHLSTAQTVITAIEGLAPAGAAAAKAAVQAQSVKMGTTATVAATVAAVTANLPTLQS